MVTVFVSFCDSKIVLSCSNECFQVGIIIIILFYLFIYLFYFIF